MIRRYEGCYYTRLESYYIIFYFETDWSCSNVDGEYNSESDEYNCGRDFVGYSINTNTSI